MKIAIEFHRKTNINYIYLIARNNQFYLLLFLACEAGVLLCRKPRMSWREKQVARSLRSGAMQLIIVYQQMNRKTRLRVGYKSFEYANIRLKNTWLDAKISFPKSIFNYPMTLSPL